jgi:hypothetical protein
MAEVSSAGFTTALHSGQLQVTAEHLQGRVRCDSKLRKHHDATRHWSGGRRLGQLIRDALLQRVMVARATPLLCDDARRVRLWSAGMRAPRSPCTHS